MVKPGRPDEWSSRLAAVLDQVRPQLARTFGRYRIPVADSEDLMQNALLALFTSWSQVREPASWLVGTVRNQCRKYVQGQLASKIVPAGPEQLERLAGAAAGGAEQICTRLDLARLLGALTPRQRNLLWLVFRLGLDECELARVLGDAKPASLRQARRRACRRLRELMTAGR
ncbi:MAG TPA: sigma-70 family RNA polymerase sigma factor [Thermoanaerobaculia bacterium]|nr:sigma-70 family RNA polymerase sigma factor [Thermoanaerobaculia bacterium]